MAEPNFVSTQEWAYFTRDTLAEAMRATADYLDAHFDGGAEDTATTATYSIVQGRFIVGVSGYWRAGKYPR